MFFGPTGSQRGSRRFARAMNQGGGRSGAPRRFLERETGFEPATLSLGNSAAAPQKQRGWAASILSRRGDLHTGSTGGVGCNPGCNLRGWCRRLRQRQDRVPQIIGAGLVVATTHVLGVAHQRTDRRLGNTGVGEAGAERRTKFLQRQLPPMQVRSSGRTGGRPESDLLGLRHRHVELPQRGRQFPSEGQFPLRQRRWPL